MGPTTVGLVSDLLVDQYGTDSLRYALMSIIPTAMFISGVLYMIASRFIREYLSKAPD